MTALLVEIGCEELPYKTCESIVRQLEGRAQEQGLVARLLAEERLLPPAGESGAAAAERSAASVRVLVSPRRIAVLVNAVPERQTPLVQEFRGPRAGVAFDADGALTKAGQGFARSRGAQAADVRRETVDGTEFAVVRVESERRPAVDVLPALVGRLITGLQIPRGMRWGRRPAGADEYLRFSRPIRWLVCKLGADTVPGEFYGLAVGDLTQGHRVLGSPVVIARAEDYESLLDEQRVVASQEERRARIVKGLDARAAELHGSWSDPGDVLAEAVYLAEWPSVARGSISESHLRLPDDVLVTAMQSHQRYFPVRDAAGRLLPAFVYVSNADPAAAEAITRGNERVLEGRLDDAEFAYDRDLAEGLEAMAGRLGQVVFHEKLGSLADKVERIEELTRALAEAIDAPADEGAYAVRAAHLAKADLVTHAVIEFTSLQGVMGMRYAQAAGEAEGVAEAIVDHYRPRHAGDEMPRSLAGKLVSIADKLDTIVGIFAIGQGPTGSADPYALRRSAIGILTMMVDGGVRFDLDRGIGAALEGYAEALPSLDPNAVGATVKAFFDGRLAVMLKDRGFTYDEVDAVMAVTSADPADTLRRITALAAFRRTEAGADLSVAFRRAANLADPAAGTVTDPLLMGAEEGALDRALVIASERVGALMASRDYDAALAGLADLRAPVDAFFESVLVMDKDEALRRNRLALLNRLGSLFNGFADFGKLAG